MSGSSSGSSNMEGLHSVVPSLTPINEELNALNHSSMVVNDRHGDWLVVTRRRRNGKSTKGVNDTLGTDNMVSKNNKFSALSQPVTALTGFMGDNYINHPSLMQPENTSNIHDGPRANEAMLKQPHYVEPLSHGSAKAQAGTLTSIHDTSIANPCLGSMHEGPLEPHEGDEDCGIIEAVRHTKGPWLLSVTCCDFRTIIIDCCSHAITINLHCGLRDWL
ncbi:unnamed protein product [Lupinus luteus]|uniref:Uncharacterized protein n=1 Tax=Lupinus luteus TaxID=3873 RepID=A0AAV1XUT2_LUPLU